MVQTGDTLNRFKRIVRDISKDLNQKIELKISGGDTELDKTAVEKISDPLTHLIRNALDHGKLTAKALENGIITPNQQLTPGDINRLIFAPDFSTAKEVSNLSGRRVGMDVINKNIDALRGQITVDSTLGEGATYSIR